MESKPTYKVSETKALTVAKPLTPDVWQMIMAIGEATHDSKQFGVFHPEEAAIKMLVAYEHGIPLTSALSAVYVIDKKPTLAPALLWAKVLASPDFDGYDEKRLEKSGAFFGWEITLRRKGGHLATRRFTLDDATRAGLINKNNWQNYPEDVCFWRTLDRVIKVVFGDIAQGLHTADELGADITPDGDVIDSPGWTITTPQAPEPPPAVVYGTLESLMVVWTPEEIMAANDGRIPATEAECQAVALKLLEDLEAAND